MESIFLTPFFHRLLYTTISLEQCHGLRAYILFHIARYKNTVVAIQIHLHYRVYSLQEDLLINTSQDKADFLKNFQSLTTRDT